MNYKILALSIFTMMYLSSCQKDSVAPSVNQTLTVTPKTVTSTPALAPDTISNVTGYLRLQLGMDSINTDNILINFKPGASTTYSPLYDAPTFQGFGLVSLSSLSSNNIPLAINTLPLTHKGLTIGLKIGAKTDGIYSLYMVTIQTIPASYHIWLMDKYKNDSLDYRQNKNYAFNIYKADTSSYGASRFKLVIRKQ